MIKKILVSATLATAVAALTVAGCGGSSSNNNGGNSGNDSGTGATGGGDSGGGTTPGKDGGGPPTSDAGTGNPPLPDGSVYPHGNQLVPGATLALDGVTSDDFVIYTDTASNTAYAISLAAGSKPISLGTVDGNNDVAVNGKVVLIGTTVSNQTGVGAVSVWTSAAAAPTPLSTSTFVGAYAVSADGSHVAFLDGVDATGSTGAIAVAGSDASGKATLVSSVDLTNNNCVPSMLYGGAHVVASYCLVAAGDAGAADAGADAAVNVNVATVSSFTTPSWTPVSIATNVTSSIAVDAAGTKVLVNGAAGTVAYPIGGGTAVTIDATGALGVLTSSPGALTKDGSHVVYPTPATALERAPTTAPAAPTQLDAARKFGDVLGFSPDENWAIGALTAGAQGQSDLYLASATTAGSAITLSAASTSQLFGDAFTVDSSHALFYTAIKQGAGTLNALAVTGGGAPTVLGTAVWEDFATSGAKVIYNDNYNRTTGSADLRSVDTSTTATPALVVTQADGNFFLNTAKSTLIYTWSYQTGASAGLWTLPAP